VRYRAGDQAELDGEVQDDRAQDKPQASAEDKGHDAADAAARQPPLRTLADRHASETERDLDIERQMEREATVVSE
jgi:hypothetical protein